MDDRCARRLLDLQRSRLTPGQQGRLLHTSADIAEFVQSEMSSQKWGRKERVPWNHPVIGYTSLGIAGLVLREDDREGDEWFDLGVECAVRYCGFVFKQLGTLLHGLDAVGRRRHHALTVTSSPRRIVPGRATLA